MSQHAGRAGSAVVQLLILVVVTALAAACSDGDVTGPEPPVEVLKDIHCHPEDDPPDDGDDGPIFATSTTICHYVPGGGGSDGSDDRSNGGGAGGSRDENLGFLTWIDPSYDQIPPGQQVRCPPSNSLGLQQRARAHAWCKSQAPTIKQRQTLNVAINRIAKRGPICRILADVARNLLNSKPRQFRIYKASDIPRQLPKPGGIGGSGTGIALVENWLALLNDTRGKAPYQVNLEMAIIHEVQHFVWDSKHPSRRNSAWPDYWEPLPYDKGCSGLGTAPE